jgi:hypothetical protein
MQAEDQLRVRLGESGVRAVTLRMPPLGENGTVHSGDFSSGHSSNREVASD